VWWFDWFCRLIGILRTLLSLTSLAEIIDFTNKKYGWKMMAFFLLSAASLLVSAASSSAAPSTNPYSAGFPSPWSRGGPGWDEAYEKAREFVSSLTLVEKVNLTTGTGWEADRW